MIGPHLSISDLSSAASCCRVEPPTRTPRVARLLLTPGSDRSVAVAALILAMMSDGVLAGTKSAYHADTSKPGTPDSATVGRSMAVGNRSAVLTARPRT